MGKCLNYGNKAEPLKLCGTINAISHRIYITLQDLSLFLHKIRRILIITDLLTTAALQPDLKYSTCDALGPNSSSAKSLEKVGSVSGNLWVRS